MSPTLGEAGSVTVIAPEVVFTKYPSPDVDSRGDLNRATGFTIQLGQIDSAGNVTGATTTDPLTDPINYFYVSLGLSVAGTVGGVSGGGSNCSAGPVTLEVVNG